MYRFCLVSLCWGIIWKTREGCCCTNFLFFPGRYPTSRAPGTSLQRCGSWQRSLGAMLQPSGPCQLSDLILWWDPAISRTMFPSGNWFLSLFQSSLRALPQPLTLLHRHYCTFSSILNKSLLYISTILPIYSCSCVKAVLVDIWAWMSHANYVTRAMHVWSCFIIYGWHQP